MFIDLSVALNNQTPVYPGDPAIKIEPAGVLERDGYVDHYVSMGTHVGTHMDAPAHMLVGGKTLDQLSVDQFIGPGKYIKVDKSFNLDVLRKAGLKPGDIVLFDTGLGDHYHEPDYFHEYPVMSEEIANYLAITKVKMVGFDTGSADNSDGFPIHKILLAGDVLIVENLTNLNQLAGKQFRVYALPIKLEVDGAPTRVIAEVKE